VFSRGGCRPPGPPRKKAFGPTKKAPKIDPKIIKKIGPKIDQKSDQKLEAKSADFGGAQRGAGASRPRPFGYFLLPIFGRIFG